MNHYRSEMFTKEFWLSASERAIKTFAQFIIVLAGSSAFNVFAVDWMQILGLSLGGALLSYATSIVSAGIKKKDDPSLV